MRKGHPREKHIVSKDMEAKRQLEVYRDRAAGAERVAWVAKEEGTEELGSMWIMQSLLSQATGDAARAPPIFPQHSLFHKVPS